MRKLCLALEDELEVDKLYQKEQDAKQSSEYDILYTGIQSEQDIEDAYVEEETNETNETSDSIDDSELTDAQESFKTLINETVAVEDFAQLKDVMLDAIRSLGRMGLHYTPLVLAKVYKGTLYLMARLGLIFFKATELISRVSESNQKTFEALKADIGVLKKTLSSIEDTEVDLDALVYSNQRVINQLVIGENEDLTANVKILTRFIEGLFEATQDHINKEVSLIRHIINSQSSGSVKVSNNIMLEFAAPAGMGEGALKGYETDSEFINSFHSSVILPGNVALMSRLPNNSIDNIDAITKAYNQSDLFLGFVDAAYVNKESLHYMTRSQLGAFLDQLDRLCDVCLLKNEIYRDNLKTSSILGYKLKHYFMGIVNADKKVSVKESLLEYVYLKFIFIQNVYIRGLTDTHKYANKVISNALLFAKDNVKKLS